MTDPLRIYRSALAHIEPNAQVGWLAGRMGITQAVARDLLNQVKAPEQVVKNEGPKLPAKAEAAATTPIRRRLLMTIVEAGKPITKTEVIYRASVSEHTYRRHFPQMVAEGVIQRRRHPDGSTTFGLRGVR